MRIFKKVKKDNVRDIYLFGKKVFSYTKNYKKNILKERYNSIEYTNQYKNVIEKLHEEQISDKYPNCVWQLWFQGEENAPDIVKKCLKTVKKYCHDKNIIVLDENTIDDFVEIAPHIKEKYKKGIISKAHYSDYIRTCLLVKYGGIWIDATVMLTSKIPDEICSQDFFQFKSATWSMFPTINSYSTILSIKNMKKKYDFHSGSNWFLVSKPNTVILIALKQLLEEYWLRENCLVNYYIFHDFLSFVILNNSESRRMYNQAFSLNNRNPHILQSLLYQEFSDEIFNEVKNISSIHKLTFKINKEKLSDNCFYNYLIKDIMSLW